MENNLDPRKLAEVYGQKFAERYLRRERAQKRAQKETDPDSWRNESVTHVISQTY